MFILLYCRQLIHKKKAIHLFNNHAATEYVIPKKTLVVSNINLVEYVKFDNLCKKRKKERNYFCTYIRGKVKHGLD